jgi:hypothetical protein
MNNTFFSIFYLICALHTFQRVSVFCNRKVLSFAKINAREGVSIFAGKPKEKTEQSND